MKETLTNLIDKHLLAEQEKNKSRERSGLFNPSMFGRCFRAQRYNQQNIIPSNPIDVRTLRIFAVGDLFHDFAQQFLPAHQVEVEVVYPGLLRGFADIVTEDAVYDIKSQHSQAFWYMQKTDYDIATERKPNILQVMCYAMLLKKPEGRLVFISKDDLCMEEYSFITAQWMPLVEEELNTLAEINRTVPLPEPIPRAYGKDKKTGNPNECHKYCPWRDMCFTQRGIKLPERKV